MKKFFLSDMLYGFLLTAVFILLYLGGGYFLETAELKFYDLRSKIKLGAGIGNEIAVIAIDDDSLAKIGRWPWPRTKIAEILALLSSENSRPAVIGLNILFSEAEKNPGLLEIDSLKQTYSEMIAARRIKEASKDSAFLKAMDEAKIRLDNDSKLASAIASAGNIVLPMYFVAGESMGGSPAPMPEKAGSFAMPMAAGANESAPLEANQAIIPLETLLSSAAGLGHVNIYPDVDGTVRREYLALVYNESFYSSFAAEILRSFNAVKTADTGVTPGKTVKIGKAEIPTDNSSAMMISYNGPDHTFQYYSFFDVLNGKVAPEAFKNKIVLIGPTAVGVGTLYVTPVAHNFPGVEIVATVVENILHKKFMLRPPWAFQAELLLLIFVGLFITFALPRLKALMGAAVTAVLLAGIAGAGIYFFTAKDQWLKAAYPVLLLAAGYTIITSKRFLVTEKKKELVEASAIETNKMLGLSFQGQGMLDLAFEKFRICPLDNTMTDLLYNLGLDFERKRQFNKAVAVYEHIAVRDIKYKDIQKKIEMLKKAADGAVFGTSLGKGREATVIMEGSTMAPTLGRYEIQKELGKGAMGIVYLGKDPKINRTVAIKTMRFEDDIDEKTLKEVKIRFFREAQAAGNLSHPNILKIFDAGEEQEMAYIAMELLKGDDLKKWAAKDALLPVEKVLEYIAKVADALDYAHKQGVIHRDIKPANIMLLEDGSVRVTDFGIARIQESSKTATGTVLGTPYYMSPEQIAGKKVDGRSDIFSLGVTLYELLTGERPWKGGESIGTLFFQIASDPYPDPLSIRPDMPEGIKTIIDRALKKNPDERYQKAGEMAADINALLSGREMPPPSAKPQTQPAAANPQTGNISPQTKPATAQAIPSARPAVKSPPPQRTAPPQTKPAVPAAARPPLQKPPASAPKITLASAQNPAVQAKPPAEAKSPALSIERPPLTGIIQTSKPAPLGGTAQTGNPATQLGGSASVPLSIERPPLTGIIQTSKPTVSPVKGAESKESAPLRGTVSSAESKESAPLRGTVSSAESKESAPATKMPSAAGIEKPFISAASGKASIPESTIPLIVEPTAPKQPAPGTKPQEDVKPKPEPEAKAPAPQPAAGPKPSAQPLPQKKTAAPNEKEDKSKNMAFEKTLPIIYPDEEMK